MRLYCMRCDDIAATSERGKLVGLYWYDLSGKKSYNQLFAVYCIIAVLVTDDLCKAELLNSLLSLRKLDLAMMLKPHP